MDLNCLLIFDTIAEYFSKIEYQDTNDEIKEMRKGAILRLLPHALYFQKMGYRIEIIQKMVQKKCHFVFSATTKQEIFDIMQPSLVYYNYSELVPKNRYHVIEEELLLWFEVIPYCKLNDLAISRIFKIFKEIFPEEYRDVIK